MLQIENVFDIANYLKDKGFDLEPCSEDEVISLEIHFNITFPQVYKNFLLRMGKGAGSYMRGTDAFFKDLFLLKSYAEETISEYNLSPLPADAFVFWMHQGYIYAYFVAECENPPVTVFYESGRIIEFSTLFEFFKSELHLDGFIKIPG
ncbi:SMI1/KNR4 family protein [Chitinophaga sp. Cy-1792]|uniref:SMI1/KNR4 family protein n=1 Tax=Chitinophaga sp. Cy-1792 TaxID=2608339 RepID=UPI0014218EC6|nr:SMI1/KNR4 family protein [Chitinophaga sp. Cy-1792]NIG55385.1 SMI1/KNR4 family protein [Chitinophaga sp. Cy-1792]